MVKIDQSLSKTELLEDGLVKVFCEIKNLVRWSEKVAVTPEIFSFKMKLLEILLIRVLESLVYWQDWIIYGKQELEESESEKIIFLFKCSL